MVKAPKFRGQRGKKKGIKIMGQSNSILHKLVFQRERKKKFHGQINFSSSLG
jgi:hypothetical protein